MLPTPTWQGMPIEIKEQFLAYLGYKSRLRLRVCSKTDRDLVDASPIALRSVSLYLSQTRLYITGAGESVKIHDDVVEQFYKIFQHNGSTVESLTLAWNRDAADDVKETLFTRLETLPRIKAKSFSLYTYEISAQEFRRLFQSFALLKKICIASQLSKESLEYLIESDVWKNAEIVQLFGEYDISVDAFLHLNYIECLLDKLTAVDAWKLINSFINRETLKQQVHFFSIKYIHDLTEEQLVSEFKIDPEKLANPSYGTPNDAKYIYRFRTRSNGLVLNVEIETSGHERHFNGYIGEESA